MHLKDLIVHADDSSNSDARVGLALELAAANDAHLAGIYVRPPYYAAGFVAAEVGPEVFEILRKIADDTASRAKARFLAAAEKTDVTIEWRESEGPLDEMVAMHARYADLAIVGQPDPDGEATVNSYDIAGRVVLYSGRPTLVAPYIYKPGKLPERVLVAWNASREAARSVNDALPFLQRAKSVSVISVNPHRAPDKWGELPGADISLHLARHGVKVEASQFVAEDVEVGDMLLSRIADWGIELLVMGGYGRSRLREFALGGTSRHILHHMTVPVFMAH